MNTRPRKRIVDTEAMAAIVSTLQTQPTLVVNFASLSEAKRIRFEFYTWRKTEQMAGNPTYGATIRTRLEGTALIFTTEGDAILRQALRNAGISPGRAHEPSQPDETLNLQELIGKLYTEGEPDGPGV
ncbi:MAG TPA: hypothetical protein VLH56_19080 [Dissulfurispiraceae bacterium]|nr:hypothetical protein [Dissulfurispiraceae bacterium]